MQKINGSRIFQISKAAETAQKDVFDSDKLPPKEVFMSWTINLKREGFNPNKKFARTFIIIAIVLGLILAIMQDFVLILGIASIIFVSYVFTKYQLGEAVIEISSHGISYDGKVYYWHELKNFFFSERGSSSILIVGTRMGLP